MSENEKMMQVSVPRSQNLWWASVVVALVGLLISLYSVKHHLDLRASGQTDAACNVSAEINCDAVASSKYSEIMGVPIGVFGAGYFLAMLLLAATTAKGHKSRREHEPAWFILSLAGVVASVVLAGISLGVIGKACLVCFGIYGVTLTQAGLAYALFRNGDNRSFAAKNVGNGLTSAAVALALSVVAYNFLKPAAELPKELQDVAGRHDNEAAVPPHANLVPLVKDIPINRTPYSGAGEDYRLGSDDAKVVIVEFADYQCPACADASKTLDELYKVMGDRILIVFKNFPLSNQCNGSMTSNMHPYSCDISRLARCAGQYGKFWEYHGLAFDDQRNASLERAKEWGRKVGMTDAQMQVCLTSNDILAKIRDDIDLGTRSGVDGTPTIFINGRKYLGGRSVSALQATIEAL